MQVTDKEMKWVMEFMGNLNSEIAELAFDMTFDHFVGGQDLWQIRRSNEPKKNYRRPRKVV